MDIRRDDLSGPEVAAFLQEHLHDMHKVAPPESVHALDLENLRQPDITFWTFWDAGILAGCGALNRVPHRAFERLERHAGKLARAVLRGLGGSNPARLPGAS